MTTSEQRGRRWRLRNDRIVRALREIKAGCHRFTAKDVALKANMSSSRAGNILKFTNGVRYVGKGAGWAFTGEDIEVPA